MYVHKDNNMYLNTYRDSRSKFIEYLCARLYHELIYC